MERENPMIEFVKALARRQARIDANVPPLADTASRTDASASVAKPSEDLSRS